MIKKRKLGKFIFLNLITLGIYGLFFWSKWTKDLNTICDGDDKESGHYVLVFILDVFSLGINALVWNYQMVERMYQKAKEYNITLKHGGMFVAIWRILPIVSSVYKIKYFNKLVDAYNATVEAAPAVEAPAEEVQEAPVEETVEETVEAAE